MQRSHSAEVNRATHVCLQMLGVNGVPTTPLWDVVHTELKQHAPRVCYKRVARAEVAKRLERAPAHKNPLKTNTQAHPAGRPRSSIPGPPDPRIQGGTQEK